VCIAELAPNIARMGYSQWKRFPKGAGHNNKEKMIMQTPADFGKVLYIDLKKRSTSVKDRGDLFEKYLGGTGVGIQLLKEECPQGTDPLGERNPIIFAIGPFNGIYPIASKTVAMFKSPLTGNLGESHAGGRSAIALRMAGYGAIVINGKSDMPVYLTIDKDTIRIKDASALWGVSNSYTVGRILREAEGGLGTRAIMRIGKAGENLVRYAGIMTETYRHFGRLGLGAVFGSKNLKAILISGKDTISMPNPKAYRTVYDDLYKALTTSGQMKKYHDIGTAMNVLHLQEMRSLPTKNLQLNQHEFAEALSGENFAKNYLGRRVACAHCPVACIHVANLREPYQNDPYFYKTKFICYDHEPIFAIGTMLCMPSPEKFLKLMDHIEAVGVDVMSTGVALAWATEAQEKGLITTAETGGITLKWGDADAYIKAVNGLVEQSTEFYSHLAKGTRNASQKYGGQDFALQFGGNEMPGYHTGMAGHLGFLVGARHSHLDGAGYSLDLKLAAEKKVAQPEAAAKYLYEEESWRQILSSLVICFFARNVFTADTISQAMEAIGPKMTPDELKRLGKEILKEKTLFKMREGFTFTDQSIPIPQRILTTPTSTGQIREEDIKEGIRIFEKLVLG
jgi:aldehyde:ferredoxin oxidoreductase